MRAVVRRQTVDLAHRKCLPKRHHCATRITPTEAVNTLSDIPDEKQIPAPLRKCTGDFPLNIGCILRLIHEDIVKCDLILGPDTGIVAEQQPALEKKVIKVKAFGWHLRKNIVFLRLRHFIAAPKARCVNNRGFIPIRIEIGQCGFRLFGVLAHVLTRGNSKQGRLAIHFDVLAIRRGWKLVVYSGASEDGTNNTLLPVLIGDFKLALFAINIGPLPLYDAKCMRVEGANPNTIKDFGADEGQQAVRHVIRRTTGKGRDQNPLGRDSFGEEARNAPDENGGLSRAGPSKHQRSAFVKAKSGLLTGIQTFGEAFDVDMTDIYGCFRRRIGDHASTQNTASYVPVRCHLLHQLDAGGGKTQSGASRAMMTSASKLPSDDNTPRAETASPIEIPLSVPGFGRPPCPRRT